VEGREKPFKQLVAVKHTSARPNASPYNDRSNQRLNDENPNQRSAEEFRAIANPRSIARAPRSKTTFVPSLSASYSGNTCSLSCMADERQIFDTPRVSSNRCDENGYKAWPFRSLELSKFSRFIVKERMANHGGEIFSLHRTRAIVLIHFSLSEMIFPCGHALSSRDESIFAGQF